MCMYFFFALKWVLSITLVISKVMRQLTAVYFLSDRGL